MPLITPNEIGFELETVSPVDKYKLSEYLNNCKVPTVVKKPETNKYKDIAYVRGGLYSLMDDSSISPKEGKSGVEIRSFVVTINELDRFRSLFVALKDLGVTTNPRCGLHIHVSNPNHAINARRLMENTKHEQVRVKESRQNYTSWNKFETDHYAAVNQRKSNHVEFRWFNAAVDFRYVCRMARLVSGYVDEVI